MPGRKYMPTNAHGSGAKLGKPTIEGATAFANKLRELADRIEENPENRAASFQWQIVEAKMIPAKIKAAIELRGETLETFDYHTGRIEMHVKAIVVEPVPADKRIEGIRDYA